MKRSIIIWIILGILAAILLFLPAFSQTIEPKLGLVSQLFEMKNKAYKVNSFVPAAPSIFQSIRIH
jgi:hypothetical protein